MHLHVDKCRAVVNRVCGVVMHIIAKLQVGHAAPEVGSESLKSGTKSRSLSILEICTRSTGQCNGTEPAGLGMN